VETRGAKARLLDKDVLHHCSSPYHDDAAAGRCGKRAPAASFTHIPILLAALISALVVQPAGDSPGDHGALPHRCASLSSCLSLSSAALHVAPDLGNCEWLCQHSGYASWLMFLRALHLLHTPITGLRFTCGCVSTVNSGLQD
jgi:hypothetical protein